MSTKVVHLSMDAHNRAKEFCRVNNLRMSEWVAGLIDEAIANNRTDAQERITVPKKKVLSQLQDEAQVSAEAVPAYAAPPFWAR